MLFCIFRLSCETVKPMGEINATTKFWEMMRQCHLLYERIVWGTLLYRAYLLRLLEWFPLTCLPSIAPRISLKVELNSPMKSCFPLESQSQTMHWRDKGQKNKTTHFSSDWKEILLKNTGGEIMIYTGWSVLSKMKSQDILKPYSCSDQNKMASGISTQLAADSSVLWGWPSEASHVFQKERVSCLQLHFARCESTRLCVFAYSWSNGVLTYLVEVLYKYKLIFKTVVALGKHYCSQFYSQWRWDNSYRHHFLKWLWNYTHQCLVPISWLFPSVAQQWLFKSNLTVIFP